MKRGQYVRVSAFTLTNLGNTPDLSTLAMVSIPLWVLDGWLLFHVQPAGRIHLIARIREGKNCRGIFTSAPIIRVRSGYVLTEDTLYQVLRVPPLPDETFAKFAYFQDRLSISTNMKKGNYVRVIKMSASPDYVPGSAGAELHPAETPRPTAKANYWIEGYLAEDIALGDQISFDAHLRNCYQVDACFYTSPIVAIAGNEVMTEMSLFRVLRVPPFNPDKSLQSWL